MVRGKDGREHTCQIVQLVPEKLGTDRIVDLNFPLYIRLLQLHSSCHNKSIQHRHLNQPLNASHLRVQYTTTLSPRYASEGDNRRIPLEHTSLPHMSDKSVLGSLGSRDDRSRKRFSPISHCIYTQLRDRQTSQSELPSQSIIICILHTRIRDNTSLLLLSLLKCRTESPSTRSDVSKQGERELRQLELQILLAELSREV